MPAVRRSRRFLAASVVALTLGALAGCGSPAPSPEDRAPEAPGQTGEPPVAAAAPAFGAEASAVDSPAPPDPSSASGPEAQRDCLLIVDGETRVQGQCWVYPMGDGGLTLNTWTHGKPTQSHFAVIGVTRPGVADASWNKDPNDTHAWDPLGEVTLQDGCWTNTRVRACAR